MSALLPDRTNNRWWRENFADPGRRIHALVAKLEQDGRREKYRALERIYGEATLTADDTRLFAQIFGVAEDATTWQRTPAVRSAVDTQLNRLGRIRPRPKPMPRRGDWHAKERARLLDLWLDAWLAKLGMQDELARALLFDGLVLGTGLLHVFDQDGAPAIELVHPGSFHVDPRESWNRCNRTFYRVLPIDREVLWERFPDHRDAIEEATLYEDATEAMHGEWGASEAADLVKVVEAWRVATVRDDESGDWVPGTRLLTIVGRSGGCVLNPDEREYAHPSPPVVRYRYRSVNRSWWGLGLVESASTMQADLNEIDGVLAEAYPLMTPGILAEANSLAVKRVSNRIGKVIEYTGTPPQPWTPPAVSPDFVARGDALEQRIYRMEGISAFSSQSMKPAGLNSGVAIEAHEDVENERHAVPAQHYELAILEVAELLLCVADDIAECGDASKLRILGGRRMLEEIDYARAQRAKGDLSVVLRMTPVSRLSRSFSGRLDQADKLREMGMFPDPEDLFEVLDMPDLDAMASTRLAPRRLAELMVDNAVRDKPVLVHQYMDLQYLLRYAAHVRSEAEIDGAPDEALVRIDDLIGSAEAELARVAAAAAPPAPPTSPSPDLLAGMPGLPPTVPPGMPGPAVPPDLGGLGPPGAIA